MYSLNITYTNGSTEVKNIKGKANAIKASGNLGVSRFVQSIEIFNSKGVKI